MVTSTGLINVKLRWSKTLVVYSIPYTVLSVLYLNHNFTWRYWADLSKDFGYKITIDGNVHVFMVHVFMVRSSNLELFWYPDLLSANSYLLRLEWENISGKRLLYWTTVFNFGWLDGTSVTDVKHLQEKERVRFQSRIWILINNV